MIREIGARMIEKRKSVRKPFHAMITIDKLYDQEEQMEMSKKLPIEIFDISKGGIGFHCDEILPVNYYFNANIDLGEGRHFFTVIKILRVDENRSADQTYRHTIGCVFVGLSDIISTMIENY